MREGEREETTGKMTGNRPSFPGENNELSKLRPRPVPSAVPSVRLTSYARDPKTGINQNDEMTCPDWILEKVYIIEKRREPRDPGEHSFEERQRKVDCMNAIGEYHLARPYVESLCLGVRACMRACGA